MKTLLILFLCVSASAAPLLPLPPVVKRPAPLLSPKHASAPKATAMLKMMGFTPAGYDVPLAPCFVTFTRDQIFFDSVVDITTVQAQLRAGRGLRIEYVDALPATGGWAVAAEYGSCVSDCEAGFTWFNSVNQRVATRVFRAVEIETMTPSAVRSGLAPAIRVNPALTGFMAWIEPKKK